MVCHLESQVSKKKKKMIKKNKETKSDLFVVARKRNVTFLFCFY